MAKVKKKRPRKPSRGPTYTWHFRPRGCKVSAQVVGEELSRIIRKHGPVNPDRSIVAEMRQQGEDSPLWNCFTHDLKKALEKCNLEEARILRMRIRLVKEQDDGTRSKSYAFVSPRDGTSTALPIAQARRSQQIMEAIVEANLLILRGWLRRCRTIERLAGLVGTISDLLQHWEAEQED